MFHFITVYDYPLLAIILLTYPHCIYYDLIWMRALLVFSLTGQSSKLSGVSGRNTPRFNWDKIPCWEDSDSEGIRLGSLSVSLWIQSNWLSRYHLQAPAVSTWALWSSVTLFYVTWNNFAILGLLGNRTDLKTCQRRVSSIFDWDNVVQSERSSVLLRGLIMGLRAGSSEVMTLASLF